MKILLIDYIYLLQTIYASSLQMAFPGAYLTIIYTVLLHFTDLGINSLLLNVLDSESKAIAFSVQGLVFISYPLIGLLADIKLTRYRMICLSCWVILVSNLLLSIWIFSFVMHYDELTYYSPLTIALFIGSLVFLASGILGKGMFESTVIQFGTDQMIEASSAQLSTFIRWYYWSLYVGNICVDVITAVIISLFSQCYFSVEDFFDRVDRIVLLWIFIIVAILQSILSCVVLLLLYLKKFKNYLNIETVGTNPVKKIIDVIKYAYHHKYPVRRSALSYYLNTYPSRLDFGKVQYGGPFTNEEVENTKTVLRLLVLLLSLFGFYLSSDGFSTASHILIKSCPSSVTLLFLVVNPSLITNVITLVGIPSLHLFINSSLGKYFPNMLKRMWFGLVLLFFHELSSLIINSQVIYTKQCDPVISVINISGQMSPLSACYFSLIPFSNNTEWNTTDCVTLCPSSLYTMDSTLMWLLVPQILHGFGYMLVFVSVLEFICAQAPFRLKGFMVGIWYAMFCINFLLLNMIEYFIISFYKEDRGWIIYESIKIGIIGLSLIIFGISCRLYRYRERDEVVNVQGMIEDIFEKELLQQQNEEDSSDDEDTVHVLISSQINYNTFDPHK